MALLKTMEALGLPLHQILPMAEQEGMPIPELVAWTDGFLQRVAFVDSPSDAAVLVFGCVRRWGSLWPEVRAQGSTLLQDLLMGGRLEHLASLRDADCFSTFRTRVLRRLGYPTCLAQSHRLKVTSPRHLRKVMAWLGSGAPVLAYELELRGFEAVSARWGTLHATQLELRNGHSPEQVDWRADPADPVFWNRPAALKMQQVRGLRHLACSRHGVVRLQACPDLVCLDGPCTDLTVEDCPRLESVWIGTRSRRLSLKGCAQVRAIQAWAEEYPGNPNFGSEWIFELQALTVVDCPNFRGLPSRLHIRERLHLQDMGPNLDWPWDFRVDGDFLVRDCAALESLPAVELQGSLLVSGQSGLRRLSPGTVIGRNLDLRACTRLEDFPRGVKVGGCIYLPVHLNHRRQEYVSDSLELGEDLEIPQPDLYEELRNLLKVLRFPALIPVADRLSTRVLAEASLPGLRDRALDDPRFEALLLWTASEVWRDLAEEAWAAANPMAQGFNDSDEDLPLAWFLELLQA